MFARRRFVALDPPKEYLGSQATERVRVVGHDSYARLEQVRGLKIIKTDERRPLVFLAGQKRPDRSDGDTGRRSEQCRRRPA